jgi:hypothetical protein
LEWPIYVLKHLLWVITSHIFIVLSWLAERSRWPNLGKNSIL